jgi:hypothetical protein
VRVKLGSEERSSTEMAGNNYCKLIGCNFLELLKYLRVVILQDAVFLMENEGFKYHYIFNNQIFTSPEFINYANDLKQLVNITPVPQEIQLAQITPILAEGLQDLKKGQAQLGVMINQQTSSQSIIQNSSSKIEEIAERVSKKVVKGVFLHLGRTLNLNSDNNSGDISFENISNTGDISFENISNTQTDNNNSTTQVNETDTFVFNQTINSVILGYEEYKIGINGLPSIKFMDASGVEWRREPSIKQFYLRRKSLWLTIEKLKDEGESETQALLLLTNLMESTGKKKLRGFCDFLKIKLAEYVVNEEMPFSTWLLD